jgi:hypothetical protein
MIMHYAFIRTGRGEKKLRTGISIHRTTGNAKPDNFIASLSPTYSDFHLPTSPVC